MAVQCGFAKLLSLRIPALLKAVLAAAFSLALAQAADPDPRFYYDIPSEPLPEVATISLIEQGDKALQDDGLTLFLNYWGDFLANPIGGLSQEASWMQLLVAGGEADLEKILGWSGASLTVSITDAAGSNLSNTVGNVFTISQAYVMNTFALYNLVLKQKFLEDRLEISLGRLSPGQNFATLPAMGLVVSGAVNGNPTSLFLNSPFQATPNASWAGHAKFHTSKDSYVEAGVFQASPRLGNPAYHGADFSIRPGDGILVLAEMGWTPTFGTSIFSSGDGKSSPSAGLPGLYSIGAYYANYSFSTYPEGSASNAFGFYALSQQMFWRNPLNPQQHMSLWGGLTLSPQTELSPMPLMGLGGFIWQGPLPSRDSDSLLLSAYIGGFSSPYANAQAATGAGRPTVEAVLEASYIIQLTKNLQFQPDLQWIFQPGGTGDIPGALVIGFQVAISF